MSNFFGTSYYIVFNLKKYWALVLWISFSILLFSNTYRTFRTRPQYYYLRTILGGSLCISRGTAPVLILCSVLVILLVCRSLHTVIHHILAKISSGLLAVWLSKVKIMHMVCAGTLTIFSILHTVAHIVNMINFSKYYSKSYLEINLAKFEGENPALLICTWTGCSGIAMIIILFTITITSTTKFRKKHFNAFYLTHRLFLVYLLLLLTHPFSGILKEQSNVNQHKPGCILFNETKAEPTHQNLTELCKEPPKFKCMYTPGWIWISITLLIYIIEVLHRKYKTNTVEAIQACRIFKNAVYLRLKCSENCQIDAGQYVLIQCNEISRIEWHPFTVTKCPQKDCQSFDVLISIKGDWTKKLKSKIQSPYAFDEKSSYISRMHHKPLQFSVNGPFASPMQTVKKCSYVICVAAGIGITSYIATFRFLLKNTTDTPKRIHLIWLTRDPMQLLWCSKLLSDLKEKFWNLNQPDRFQVQLFITNSEKKNEVHLLLNNNKIKMPFKIKMGRPNWKEEFRIFKVMYKSKKISLFCCGPKTLKQDLKTRCENSNRQGSNYQYIQEGF